MLFMVLLVFIIEIVESAVKRGVVTNELSRELMDNENEVIQSDGLICPTEPHGLPLFSYKCKTDEDCRIFGEQCCQEGRWKICRQGVYKRKQEPKHKPLLPGIPRFCPSKEAIIEILPVQNCTKDIDCGPRICCPDGKISYCRTAVLKWDYSTLSPRFIKTFRNIVSYLQCTAPPPPLLDFFPKPCKNTLDCFPNLCCQEQGKKVCRPPKRSLLTLLTALT